MWGQGVRRRWGHHEGTPGGDRDRGQGHRAGDELSRNGDGDVGWGQCSWDMDRDGDTDGDTDTGMGIWEWGCGTGMGMWGGDVGMGI